MVLVGHGKVSCLICNSNFTVFENVLVEKRESSERTVFNNRLKKHLGSVEQSKMNQ